MALRCWDEHVLGVPRPANILLWAMLFIKVNRCNSLPSPLVPETVIQAYAREVYGTGGAMPDFSTKQFLYSDQALNHSYAKAYVRWMFPNLSTCFVFTAHGDTSCRRTMWPEWYPNRGVQWADNEGSLLYNPSFRGDASSKNWNFAEDNTWVEVTRWKAGCRQPGWKQCEGLSAVFTFGNRSHARVIYGCWFFIARGTGIFVNSGRSKRFSTRTDAARFFNADYHSRDDSKWCSAALAQGYDSFQLGVDQAEYVRHESRKRRDLTELIICSGACATQELCGVCPPLELRSGSSANLPCECSEAGGMLNCKSHATAPPCDAAHKPVMPLTSASALAIRHLALYQQELKLFRREFSSRSLPPIKWFMFGMGRRQKLVYRSGELVDAINGTIIQRWTVISAVINPPHFEVVLIVEDGYEVRVYENETAVWIHILDHERSTATAIAGTMVPVVLPSFKGMSYPAVRRVLLQETLVNIMPNGAPVPNLFAYATPWYRDGAMVALVLNATGNSDTIRDWVVSLRELYDRNNGVSEPDNLGQVLYLISLASNSSHPLVSRALAEAARLRRTTFTGPYITGKTDFAVHPVYQTAWLKFGSTALCIIDDWGLPAISDSYKDIFWMPLSNQPEKPTSNQSARPRSPCKNTQWHANFPYLTWACDHTHRTKHGPISDQDWPLTFEAFGSRANHENVGRRVDQRYASSKIVAPHSWHAAEVFLYLHASQ